LYRRFFQVGSYFFQSPIRISFRSSPRTFHSARGGRGGECTRNTYGRNLLLFRW
jgi:hypothetical protein